MATRLVVNAGPHSRSQCPVTVQLKPSGVTSSRLVAIEPGSGQEFPCQIRARGEQLLVSWIVPALQAGEEREFVLENASAEQDGDGVELVKGNDKVDVSIGGTLFTSFHTGGNWARPFLHPVIGPHGAPVTRAFPVIEGVEGETQDHPHHKSIWVAWGEVNGSDNWSENKDRGHGSQRLAGVPAVVSGPVFGRIGCSLDWFSEKDEPVVAEDRELVFWNTPADGRLIDLTVTFRATRGPVRFGDTKEGGICSVRVASSMDASGEGTIRNSYGGTNEKETWGKRAQWCDYVGPVQERTVGIAIFDHDTNLRHPTYWHVRNYGLMTANPFGVSYFRGDRTLDGSWRLEGGGRVTFRYRIYIHDGGTVDADVAEKYHDFINPPVAATQ